MPRRRSLGVWSLSRNSITAVWMREGSPRQLFFLIVLLTACGPFGPVPGNQIGGQLTSAPMDGWSFSDAFWTIELDMNSADPF